QAVIRDGDGRFVARVDFLLGSSPVVIEFDGKIKYDGVDGKQALVDEKVREDRLRALGYEIVRLTWADLARQGRVKALVMAAAKRAGSRGHAPLRAG
ncbi:MAG: PDDEXK family nuclease, partial [Dermatophilaceae bacterium]